MALAESASTAGEHSRRLQQCSGVVETSEQSATGVAGGNIDVTGTLIVHYDNRKHYRDK